MTNMITFFNPSFQSQHPHASRHHTHGQKVLCIDISEHLDNDAETGFLSIY